VSRHATAAVTMLVNELTRLGTTNNGSIEHGAAMLCCQVAVYSGPFRQHEMTVLEIIIAVLHLSNGRCVGVRASLYKTVRHLGVAIIARLTNPRSILGYHVIDMIPTLAVCSCL